MIKKVYEVKSVEEAKELAVNELGIPASELQFEVLSEKKGFLGMGGKSQVEVTCDIDGIEKGKQYLQMIFKHNDIDAFIEKKVRDNQIDFNIEAGDFNGYLIGKSAHGLVALQTVLPIVVNKYYSPEEQKIVLVDIGGYKKRKEKQLESMAVEYGKQVSKSKKALKLDNFNAYERKIIHNKLATWDNISTHSEGEEPNRYLIIEPKK